MLSNLNRTTCSSYNLSHPSISTKKISKTNSLKIHSNTKYQQDTQSVSFKGKKRLLSVIKGLLSVSKKEASKITKTSTSSKGALEKIKKNRNPQISLVGDIVDSRDYDISRTRARKICRVEKRVEVQEFYDDYENGSRSINRSGRRAEIRKYYDDYEPDTGITHRSGRRAETQEFYDDYESNTGRAHRSRRRAETQEFYDDYEPDTGITHRSGRRAEIRKYYDDYETDTGRAHRSGRRTETQEFYDDYETDTRTPRKKEIPTGESVYYVNARNIDYDDRYNCKKNNKRISYDREEGDYIDDIEDNSSYSPKRRNFRMW